MFSTLNIRKTKDNYIGDEEISFFVSVKSEDVVNIHKISSLIACEVNLECSKNIKNKFLEIFYTNIQYSGFQKSKDNEISSKFADDNLFLTREVESDEKFSEDEDSGYHSLNLNNQLPKYIYGSSNENPIKITYYFIIVVYSAKDHFEMLRIPIRVISSEYFDENETKSEIENSNPFSDDYINEVSHKLINSKFQEYFKEIAGEKLDFSLTKDNIHLKINDQPIANVKFFQTIFRVGHDITGQIFINEDASVLKIMIKLAFVKSIFLKDLPSAKKSTEHIAFSNEFHCYKQINLPFSIPCHFTFLPTFKCNIFSVEWFLDITIYSYICSEPTKVISPLTITTQYQYNFLDISNSQITSCRVPITLGPFYSPNNFQED